MSEKTKSLSQFKFSFDCKYIAFTTEEYPTIVQIYKLDTNEEIDKIDTCSRSKNPIFSFFNQTNKLLILVPDPNDLNEFDRELLLIDLQTKEKFNLLTKYYNGDLGYGAAWFSCINISPTDEYIMMSFNYRDDMHMVDIFGLGDDNIIINNHVLKVQDDNEKEWISGHEIIFESNKGPIKIHDCRNETNHIFDDLKDLKAEKEFKSHFFANTSSDKKHLIINMDHHYLIYLTGNRDAGYCMKQKFDKDLDLHILDFLDDEYIFKFKNEYFITNDLREPQTNWKKLSDALPSKIDRIQYFPCFTSWASICDKPFISWCVHHKLHKHCDHRKDIDFILNSIFPNLDPITCSIHNFINCSIYESQIFSEKRQSH